MAYDSNVEEVLRRLRALEEPHYQWKSVWEELADYIMPRKNDIYQTLTRGEKRNRQQFDSTAVHANEVLASSMAGSLTNQGSNWFMLKMRDEALNEVFEVQMWLQDCGHRMHRALQQSNFAAEILEVYLDLGCLGTGCILVEEQPPTGPFFAGLQFRACNIGLYIIDENSEGIVDTVFRRIPMTNRTVAQKWDTTISDSATRETEKHPDRERNIIHAVFPREGKRGISAKNLPFASMYIDERERVVLSEGGFWELPYAVPRWTKASREKYGRGPGHTALPDIKVLNKAKDLSLKVWAKVLDPPSLIQHDGIIGNLRLTPGGINYTRGLPREVIDQLRIDARFDVSQIKEEELRSSIRNIYWSNQLEMPQGPQMTAHEVMVRYELMQRLLGPTLGRLESELLSPIVSRVFNIMIREGALLPPPDAVIEYGEQGGNIDIQYESPIARAQRSGDAQSIQSVFEFVAPMIEIEPKIMDNFNLDEVVRVVSEVRGMPAKVMRDRRQVEQMRAERAKQEAQEREMQKGLAASQVAKNAAPMVKELDAAGHLEKIMGEAEKKGGGETE